MSKLSEAIEFANKVHPLPQCPHGAALRDHADEILEPPCGCRWAPPPETQVAQSETLDTVAIMIAKAFYDRYPVLSLKARTELANEILSALRNEREKCAKVAETVDSAFDVDPILRRKIATAIREGR